jgi:hypothetical protein
LTEREAQAARERAAEAERLRVQAEEERMEREEAARRAEAEQKAREEEQAAKEREEQRLQEEERQRALEMGAKIVEGDAHLDRCKQAIQNEDISQAQEHLRQARRLFQECRTSDRDHTMQSCEGQLRSLLLQKTIREAEECLSTARSVLSSTNRSDAGKVRARSSVNEAQKLLSEVSGDYSDQNLDSLSNGISEILRDIERAEPEVGAVKDDEATSEEYLKLFQLQDEGNVSDENISEALPDEKEDDVQQGSDLLEVESFHYSSGGDVDDFGVGNDDYWDQ